MTETLKDHDERVAQLQEIEAEEEAEREHFRETQLAPFTADIRTTWGGRQRWFKELRP